MSLFGYCRVSTKLQANHGESIETQQKTIQEYATYKHLNVRWFIENGRSGKDIEHRPELQRLLQEIKPGDYIMITDISRIARSTFDFVGMMEKFTKDGIKFICKNPDIDMSTDAGQLVAIILSKIAEIERKNIAKHIKATMDRLRKEKKLRTRAPFGWQFTAKGEDMIPHAGEQKILEKIKYLYVYEDENCNGIVKILNEMGEYKNRKEQGTAQKKFNHVTIKNILTENSLIKNPKKLTVAERVQNKVPIAATLKEVPKVQEAEILQVKQKSKEKKEEKEKKKEEKKASRIPITKGNQTPRIMSVKDKIKMIEETAPKAIVPLH